MDAAATVSERARFSAGGSCILRREYKDECVSQKVGIQRATLRFGQQERSAGGLSGFSLVGRDAPRDQRVLPFHHAEIGERTLKERKLQIISAAKIHLDAIDIVFQRVLLLPLRLQILNTLTCEVLEHQGSFRTPPDQIQYIAQTLRDRQSISLVCVRFSAKMCAGFVDVLKRVSLTQGRNFTSTC